MKNIFTFLVVLMCATGCAVDTGEESTEYYEDVADEDGSAMAGYPGSGSGYGSPCPSDVFEFELPDGTLYQMVVPGLCNPFYIYTGYPPPLNPVEELEDPLDDPLGDQNPQEEVEQYDGHFSGSNQTSGH